MVALLSFLSNWVLPFFFVFFVAWWLWLVTRPPKRAW